MGFHWRAELKHHGILVNLSNAKLPLATHDTLPHCGPLPVATQLTRFESMGVGYFLEVKS